MVQSYQVRCRQLLESYGLLILSSICQAQGHAQVQGQGRGQVQGQGRVRKEPYRVSLLLRNRLFMVLCQQRPHAKPILNL